MYVKKELLILYTYFDFQHLIYFKCSLFIDRYKNSTNKSLKHKIQHFHALANSFPFCKFHLDDHIFT